MMYYCLSILVGIYEVGAALDAHYYDKTCPQAQTIIFQAVRNATTYDPKVPARLLRMFFHDCFIRVSLSLSLSPSSFYYLIVIYIYICAC